MRAICSFCGDKAAGAVPGLFSMGEGRQVYFSQGNLQYRASTDTWRFAEHSNDFAGDDNLKMSPTFDGWIDLFAWAIPFLFQRIHAALRQQRPPRGRTVGAAGAG